MQVKKKAIIIGGPTASGKTALSLAVAKHLPVEIISADSRQLYIGLDIVSAKPTEAELHAVPHHLVSVYDVATEVTAADWAKKAAILIDEIHNRGHVPLIVGGSGLYIQALTNPLDPMPQVAPAIREKWNAIFKKYGIQPLQEALKAKDPEYYQTVDRQNPTRLIRALEVIESSGEKYSALRKENGNSNERYEFLKLKTCVERKALYQRINERVDDMLAMGLLDEARKFYPRKGLQALATIGYKELFDHFDGESDLGFAIEKIKQHTRNYAKRQETWFKRDAAYKCIDPENPRRCVEYSKNFVGNF